MLLAADDDGDGDRGRGRVPGPGGLGAGRAACTGSGSPTGRSTSSTSWYERSTANRRDGTRSGWVPSDFRGATAAAGDVTRRADEVQALVTPSLRRRATRRWPRRWRALGPDGWRHAALPPTAGADPLPAPQLRAHDLDLDALRSAAADAVGAEAPDLQQLRRITLGSIVRVAAAGGRGGRADLGAGRARPRRRWPTARRRQLVAHRLRRRSLTQLPRVTQAISTLGASPVPLPLGPVYALQLAISYINLAIPTAAARIAVNIRFFQRHGVPPGAAVAAGALDGFSGFIVQAIVLAGLLAFTPASLRPRPRRCQRAASARADRGLVIAVAPSLLAVVVGRPPPALRRRVGPPDRAEAAEAVRGLRSPRRLALLLRRQPGHRGAVRHVPRPRSPGRSATRSGIERAARSSTSAWPCSAGLLPVPGGIGVTEGGLTYGLVQRRRARGGRPRRRPALPARLVLPPAGLGVLRHALAGAQRAPVAGPSRRSPGSGEGSCPAPASQCGV